MEEKVCKRCGQLLPLSMFYKNKGTKDGHLGTCKACDKEYKKKYNEEHKEELKIKRRQHYLEHREEILLQRQEYWREHKEEMTVYQKRHRQEHIEEIRQRDALYHQTHRDERNKYGRKYYRENHEKCLANKRRYYIDNKDIIIANNQIRRARMNLADGEFTPEQIKECVDFFNGVCAYSNNAFSEEKINCLSLDHIIPISNGGSNYIWNIVPTTFSINASKGTKEMLSWYQEQDFYSEERLQKILEWQEYAYNKWGNDSIAS